MVTLQAVRASASPDLYPRHLLPGCESALVLFAAAWHGKQDAVWMAEAGLATTCVDTDQEKLLEMALVYPDDWQFVEADVFEYVLRTERQWDVVSIDCPTNLFDRCAELLPLWCRVARKAVVLGCGIDTVIVVPEGWLTGARMHRSNFNGGVCWAVLQKLTDPLAEDWQP